MQLVSAGHAFGSVAAVPRGICATIDGNGHIHTEALAPPPQPSATLALPEIAGRIRRDLDAYLAAIAAAYPQRRAFVCLSGGLDSSTVAVIARQHFPNLSAVSFDLAQAGRPPSEDRTAAVNLARDLGMPLIEATVSPDELLSWLDIVLEQGIDWRDFNVHAALVNAALANAIDEECRGDLVRPLVITGDLANEFLVDYHVEEYRGIAYYALPRLDVGRLRAILVNGIDTCHREVGVFEAWGQTVVQPYSVAVEAYLSLPQSFLETAGRKDLLVHEIVGDALPDYIYSRPKVRAQMGGTDAGGGVLGACINNGVDAAYLRRRFCALHRTTEEELDRFIRAGRYRVAIPAAQDMAYGRN
jgi:asparagine synthetase B (glutamine-hydrolysing)